MKIVQNLLKARHTVLLLVSLFWKIYSKDLKLFLSTEMSEEMSNLAQHDKNFKERFTLKKGMEVLIIKKATEIIGRF